MYGGMAAGTYTMSLAHTPASFFKNGIGLFYSCAMNDSLVTRARNYLTSQFLSSPATHLMWIDADIGFDPVDIVRMVRADKDIVCGIYPKKEIHWREVARAAREGVPPERLSEYERSLVLNLIDDSPDRVSADGLLEVANAGTGFMLIRRGVFEALADDAPSYVDGSTPGIPLKAFYAVSIDPDRVTACCRRTTTSADWRATADSRFMRRPGCVSTTRAHTYSAIAAAKAGPLFDSTSASSARAGCRIRTGPYESNEPTGPHKP